MGLGGSQRSAALVTREEAHRRAILLGEDPPVESHVTRRSIAAALLALAAVR